MLVPPVSKKLLSKLNLLKMGKSYAQTLSTHVLLTDFVLMGLANVIDNI